MAKFVFLVISVLAFIGAPRTVCAIPQDTACAGEPPRACQEALPGERCGPKCKCKFGTCVGKDKCVLHCTKSKVGGGCLKDSHCTKGLVCEAQKCKMPVGYGACRRTDDCVTGAICDNIAITLSDSSHYCLGCCTRTMGPTCKAVARVGEPCVPRKTVCLLGGTSMPPQEGIAVCSRDHTCIEYQLRDCAWGEPDSD